MALAALGHPVQALAVVDEAEKFLRGRGFKETLSWHSWFRLTARRAAGPDVGEAELAIAREAQAIAEAISGPHARAVSQTTLAVAYLGVGRFTESVATADQAITLIETSGTARYFGPVSCAAFAIAAAAAGTELNHALRVLDNGERVVAETGARGFLPELLYARARVQAAIGDHAEHRATLEHGLRVAGENGAHGWEKRFENALAGPTDPVP
jgi:hypothetical protein